MGDEFFTDVKHRVAHYSDLSPFAERAVVKEWSTTLGCWTTRNSMVLVAPRAFARGCMRSSYYVIDLQCVEKTFVAKRYRKNVKTSQYFDDVSMHSIAEFWAQKFNSYDPPKKARFVPAAVLELPYREPKLTFAIEPHLLGEFKKYNNNNGFVSEEARCTPQAFSHFTFHASGGELMIVDIQGVGDDYTDPQILSRDGEGYGRGNLGEKGMLKFLHTHRCNGVCKALSLPLIGDAGFITSTTANLTPSGAHRHKKHRFSGAGVGSTAILPPSQNSEPLQAEHSPGFMAMPVGSASPHIPGHCRNAMSAEAAAEVAAVMYGAPSSRPAGIATAAQAEPGRISPAVQNNPLEPLATPQAPLDPIFSTTAGRRPVSQSKSPHQATQDEEVVEAQARRAASYDEVLLGE